MTLRLLLMPGDHYQHKQNFHIVWLRWLVLASNMQKRKKGYIVQTNCHASTGGIHMINARLELTVHKF
jgi:hypothetical protein